MVNLNNCNFCLWGFRNKYDTFGHIHEAWYRAMKFKYPERQVLWVDDDSDTTNVDFSNTVFLSVNVAGMNNLPKRGDCFYVVHNTDDVVKASFGGDLSHYGFMNLGINCAANDQSSNIEVGPDAYLSLQPWEKYTSMVIRWGTDLLPHEVMANKPTAMIYNPESKIINFVGSGYENVQEPFARACQENGILFKRVGSFGGPVSREENERLVKESHMAPAINVIDHNKVGYIPCRVFKNISYGRMPFTNNKYVQAVFNNRLIFNEDTYQLFYDVKEQLPHTKLELLHTLMDEVAEKHTYVTKIDSLLNAVRITQENR